MFAVASLNEDREVLVDDGPVTIFDMVNRCNGKRSIVMVANGSCNAMDVQSRLRGVYGAEWVIRSVREVS